jgi:NAD(P)-dependent dehydrogenase (short-subunit alcohol dehydrogenase family)
MNRHWVAMRHVGDIEETFMNRRILIVGATGTVGQALVHQIAGRYEIIPVGRTRGDYQIDITDSASIEALFDRIGKVDAIVSVTGDLHFGPLAEMTTEQFRVGLNSKLLGQVALALIGQHFLTDGGSITLTGGTVSDEPIKFGANASTVNAALEGFVRGAAVELPRGIRINVVSPSVLQESMSSFGPLFPGIEAVPGSRVALGYVRSIEGVQTGRVYRMT